MIDLEQQFRALRPRRSLMMSYAVSLLHFEFFLLEHLQQSGVGRVTLLVDPRAYQLSFAEGLAVHGVGLDYRIAAVHLPNARASFHPKLYFFSHEGGLTLFVASANLTLGGCRRNVEVVDRIDVRPNGTGDLWAFREYSAFLRDLLEFDPTLPRAVRAEVEETVREIEALPFDPAVADGGPWFLHTLHFGLLTQISEHIPRDEVEEITACSASFDAQGTALAALADAYPHARLRIYGQADDRSYINGAALGRLTGRVTLHDFRMTAEEDEKRPLHAKLAVFRGAARSWLVSGSAHLSAPAWIRAASDSGNIEAVTLRSASGLQAFGDLFAVVQQTEPIPFDRMRWTPGDDARLDTPPPFRIAEARVQDEHVIVQLALLDPGWREAEFELIAPAEKGTAVPLRRTGGDEQAILGLSAQLAAEVVTGEAAVAVRVQARGPLGTVSVSLAWLERPDVQDRTASERALRRSVRGLERRGMLTSAGDLQRISEFLFRLSSGLGRAAQAQESATTSEAPGPAPAAGEPAATGAHEPAAAREIAGITLGEGGTQAVGSRQAEAASLLERIIQALRRARAGGDAGGQDEPNTVFRRADDNHEELTAEDLVGDEAHVDQVPDIRPDDISTMARRLTESAQEMLGDAPAASEAPHDPPVRSAARIPSEPLPALGAYCVGTRERYRGPREAAGGSLLVGRFRGGQCTRLVGPGVDGPRVPRRGQAGMVSAHAGRPHGGGDRNRRGRATSATPTVEPRADGQHSHRFSYGGGPSWRATQSRGHGKPQ